MTLPYPCTPGDRRCLDDTKTRVECREMIEVDDGGLSDTIFLEINANLVDIKILLQEVKARMNVMSMSQWEEIETTVTSDAAKKNEIVLNIPAKTIRLTTDQDLTLYIGSNSAHPIIVDRSESPWEPIEPFYDAPFEKIWLTNGSGTTANIKILAQG